MAAKKGVKRVDLQIGFGGLARFSEKDFPVLHGFSTVDLGNMSEGFGVLEEVKRNQRRFLSLLGFSLEKTVIIGAEHSDHIEVLTPKDKESIVDCDGLITLSRNLGLVLLPGDCYPVIITGRYLSKPFVSLVHAGKMGTRLEIVAKAIGMLSKEADPNKMRVAIGPGIGPCCYTGTDLVSEIVDQIIGAGVPVENIIAANCCTCCSRDSHGDYLFFSRVRAKKNMEEKEGRLMAFTALS